MIKRIAIGFIVGVVIGAMVAYFSRPFYEKWNERKEVERMVDNLESFTFSQIQNIYPVAVGQIIKVSDLFDGDGRNALFVSTGTKPGSWVILRR